MIRLLELFGGIGSPRAALRNLGIETQSLGYVENDQRVVDSYNAIFEDMTSYKIQKQVIKFKKLKIIVCELIF